MVFYLPIFSQSKMYGTILGQPGAIEWEKSIIHYYPVNYLSFVYVDEVNAYWNNYY